MVWPRIHSILVKGNAPVECHVTNNDTPSTRHRSSSMVPAYDRWKQRHAAGRVIYVISYTCAWHVPHLWSRMQTTNKGHFLHQFRLLKIVTAHQINFPAFSGIRRLITAFERSRCLSLVSTMQILTLRSINVISSGLLTPYRPFFISDAKLTNES
jgi:hypothetical protein